MHNEYDEYDDDLEPEIIAFVKEFRTRINMTLEASYDLQHEEPISVITLKTYLMRLDGVLRMLDRVTNPSVSRDD